METSYIALKWGTLKRWNLQTENEFKLINRYYELGASFGCAQQNDTQEQIQIICALIDECNNPEGIYLDWDGIYITKEKAKDYVLNYNNKRDK